MPKPLTINWKWLFPITLTFYCKIVVLTRVKSNIKRKTKKKKKILQIELVFYFKNFIMYFKMFSKVYSIRKWLERNNILIQIIKPYGNGKSLLFRYYLLILKRLRLLKGLNCICCTKLENFVQLYMNLSLVSPCKLFCSVDNAPECYKPYVDLRILCIPHNKLA